MKPQLLAILALCIWLWQLSVVTVPFPIPTSYIVTSPIETSATLAYEEPESEGFTTLIFTGDIMLGRHVERLSRRHAQDYPFAGLSLADLATNAAIIGNFEASVPKDHVPTPNYHLRFSVPVQSLSEIKEAGFTHLSLANNHAYDFGADGYAHTILAMKQLNLTSFGNPYTISDSSIAYLPTPYGQIALIGINQTFGTVSSDEVAFTLATAEAHSVKQIVYIHWGDEYKVKHSPAQKALATQLISAGADLIIGHHPHVVQDVDSINGVPVVYSLGNYIFDQYFSNEVQVGLVVALELSEQTSVLSLHPVTSIGTPAQPRLQTDFEKQTSLDSIADRSHNDLKSDVRSGAISIPWQFATSSKTAMIGQ